MFYMLVMTVKGSALMILRGQEVHNGAACWRALCKRYEPATAVRAQSIMQAVLNINVFPGTLAEFEDKIGEWERDISRYETASGEIFNEGVKKSIFLQKAPKNIRMVADFTPFLYAEKSTLPLRNSGDGAWVKTLA